MRQSAACLCMSCWPVVFLQRYNLSCIRRSQPFHSVASQEKKWAADSRAVYVGTNAILLTYIYIHGYIYIYPHDILLYPMNVPFDRRHNQIEYCWFYIQWIFHCAPIPPFNTHQIPMLPLLDPDYIQSFFIAPHWNGHLKSNSCSFDELLRWPSEKRHWFP